MKKLRSIAGIAGVCGFGLLWGANTAQGSPPGVRTNGPVLIPTPDWAANALPEAGMYQAEPFKLLVIVPRAGIDDKMVAQVPAAPRILQHVPEVRLVPRARR